MYAPTDAVTRLDRLTTRSLGVLYGAGGHSGVPRAVTPYTCLEVARAAVQRHGGIGRTYRREAAVQHLYAALWQYAQFFAPGVGWELTEVDHAHAQVRWRHDDPLVAEVIDVVAASGHPDTAALGEAAGAVLRVCNLANRTAYLVTGPGQSRAIGWTRIAEANDVRTLGVTV